MLLAESSGVRSEGRFGRPGLWAVRSRARSVKLAAAAAAAAAARKPTSRACRRSRRPRWARRMRQAAGRRAIGRAGARRTGLHPHASCCCVRIATQTRAVRPFSLCPAAGHARAATTDDHARSPDRPSAGARRAASSRTGWGLRRAWCCGLAGLPGAGRRARPRCSTAATAWRRRPLRRDALDVTVRPQAALHDSTAPRLHGARCLRAAAVRHPRRPLNNRFVSRMKRVCLAARWPGRSVFQHRQAGISVSPTKLGPAARHIHHPAPGCAHPACPLPHLSAPCCRAPKRLLFTVILRRGQQAVCPSVRRNGLHCCEAPHRNGGPSPLGRRRSLFRCCLAYRSTHAYVPYHATPYAKSGETRPLRTKQRRGRRSRTSPRHGEILFLTRVATALAGIAC